jgi:hypothetical protein
MSEIATTTTKKSTTSISDDETNGYNIEDKLVQFKLTRKTSIHDSKLQLFFFFFVRWGGLGVTHASRTKRRPSHLEDFKLCHPSI